MNEIPKVVFSNSLASADWGETTIAAGDLAEAVARLKRERPGGYLLARPRRGAVRPVAGRDRPDRRVPPHDPPGRPGRVGGSSPRRFPVEPISTTAFSGGGVAYVFTAHP
jgi:hypothetical protein